VTQEAIFHFQLLDLKGMQYEERYDYRLSIALANELSFGRHHVPPFGDHGRGGKPIGLDSLPGIINR